MAAPTFIAEAETAWTTKPSGTFKGPAFAAQAGDILVCFILYSAGNGSTAFTVERANTTWTKREEIHLTGFSNVQVWTGVVTASSTSETKVKISGTDEFSGVNEWGHNTLCFRGGTGIGAIGQAHAEGAPSLTLTTKGAHSAIVVANSDWNAVSGTSRAWRETAGTFVEKTYQNVTSAYTVYGGYIEDSGAVGEKTVGLTKPSQKYAIVAVEVLGPEEAEELTPVSADLAATYAIRETVTADLTAPYAIEANASVHADLTALYALKGTVTADLAALYAIEHEVARQGFPFPFNAPASGISTVHADLTASYRLRSLVAADLSAAYAVREGVSADLATVYALRGLVTADTAGLYAVRALASADLAAPYAIRSLASADLAALYALREDVTADLGVAYAVREPVAADLTAPYALLELVGRDLEVKYALRESVGADIAAIYRILREVVIKHGGSHQSRAFILPNPTTRAQVFTNPTTRARIAAGGLRAQVRDNPTTRAQIRINPATRAGVIVQVLTKAQVAAQGSRAKVAAQKSKAKIAS